MVPVDVNNTERDENRYGTLPCKYSNNHVYNLLHRCEQAFLVDSFDGHPDLFLWCQFPGRFGERFLLPAFFDGIDWHK